MGLIHLGTDTWMSGIEADLPDAKYYGRTYFCTDTKNLFFDTGDAWEDRTPGTGGGGGSGLTADLEIAGVATLHFTDGVLTSIT